MMPTGPLRSLFPNLRALQLLSGNQTEIYMIEQRAWAQGRSWWITAEKPQGGFVLVREDAIYTAWAALCDAKIQLRDFRIWLASFEVLERRLGLAADRKPTFTEFEFRKLIGGVGREHFRTSVRRLERAGLGRWREHAIDLPGSRSNRGSAGGRLVPIPRSILRYLAKSPARALIATTLGHVLRCLYYRGGQCVSGGYCKSSWVSQTFSVSLRQAKAARAKLQSIGFLTPLAADQLRLNRFGCPTVVNLHWVPTIQSAPHSPEQTTRTAPPDTQVSSFLRRKSDHQKPDPAPNRHGVFAKKKVSMSDVRRCDLENPSRLLILHRDAEHRGIVESSREQILSFAEPDAGSKGICGKPDDLQ
jgi:hypothetical protein